MEKISLLEAVIEFMITIYYSKVAPIINDDVFLAHLSSMPTFIQNRISSLKFPEEKYISLSGYMLLKHGLKEYGLEYTLADLKYTTYGRPYIDTATIDFNISHSNRQVVCALSTAGRIGIDIEFIRPINILDFRKIFREDEWNFITQSSIPMESFFYLWTAKESILKADGRGLNAPIHKIFIGSEDSKLEDVVWYCRVIPIFGGSITQLATDFKPDNLIIREINLEVSVL